MKVSLPNQNCSFLTVLWAQPPKYPSSLIVSRAKSIEPISLRKTSNQVQDCTTIVQSTKFIPPVQVEINRWHIRFSTSLVQRIRPLNGYFMLANCTFSAKCGCFRGSCFALMIPVARVPVTTGTGSQGRENYLKIHPSRCVDLRREEKGGVENREREREG